MPRIRKKTSKRKSIAKRERTKKQVKESRKKKTKQAKKNPQWKSKQKKDPGIPNNFPYKDQILAEVAEQRRLAAEEKQRRKDEKKAVKAQAAAEGGGEGADSEDDGAAFDGIQAISTSRIVDADADAGETSSAEAEADAEADDVPVLIDPELACLQSVLDAADVIVEVLDARDPLASRSAHIEELAGTLGKRVLLVLNKIDACPREAVEAWAAALRRDHPTVLFRAASACLPVSPAAEAASARVSGKGKEREREDDAWGLDALTPLLQHWAQEKASANTKSPSGGAGDDNDNGSAQKPLTLAVVGVTNVGKTAFVNALLRRAALETYRLASAAAAADFSPTTTTHAQAVSVELGDGLVVRVVDTPGLMWHHVPVPVGDASGEAEAEEAARVRARDILLRNRGHIERLKDPSAVISELVARAGREDLMLMYNLPIFVEGDAGAFLASVARANGFVKKKGHLDLAGAARIVLRDWSHGKLARYTLPPPPPSPPAATSSDSAPVPVPEEPLAAAYAKDGAVLSRLATRKELRKARGGLVRLRTGAVDARRVVLDAGYFVSASDDGMEGNEEDGGALESGEEGSGDEEEDEDEDADEDEDDEEEEDGDASEDEEDELVEDEEDEEEEDEDEPAPSPPPRGKRKRVPSKAASPPAKRVAFAPEPQNTKQARAAAGARGAAVAAARAKAQAQAPAQKPTKPKSKPKPAKAAAAASAPAPATATATKAKPKPKPKTGAKAQTQTQTQRKVANAASSKKLKAALPPKDGEAAYDFKQFF